MVLGHSRRVDTSTRRRELGFPLLCAAASPSPLSTFSEIEDAPACAQRSASSHSHSLIASVLHVQSVTHPRRACMPCHTPTSTPTDSM
uniref:Uncharacterized protein n=1 Tax=Physcomitrium patens TaxID=3218 RepID=A0A2K1KJX6_PHYPA|nr:hypothetical protein PHYPA_007756 [Physcomitrium patens]